MTVGVTTTHAVVRVLQQSADEGDFALQEIVDLVATLCDAPLAGIGVLDGPTYHYVIAHGIDPLVCSTSDSLCQHLMTTHHAEWFEDVSTERRFADSPFVDGRAMNIRFYASAPIYVDQGEMVGRLCVFDFEPRTLTALQERALTALAANLSDLIELRLRRQREVVTPGGAEDEIARIAAEISHDMRVPLASIVANVEMLDDELHEKVEPAAALMLLRTERAANRLLKMVDGLMHFHEVGAGQQIASVDVQALLDQVLAGMHAQLAHAGATVRARGLPVINADVDQLYSLFQNLLSNAVKFARPGVPLELIVDAVRRPGAWRISVSDNGIGVPPEQRSEVFTMFSRVSNRIEGHGIGLATVRRIVHAHGGRVGMAEAAAGGVQVWFELPA